jgi:hypothetical protein
MDLANEILIFIVAWVVALFGMAMLMGGVI